MSFFQRLAEERILRAQQEGAVDSLPGKGKPLNFEDDSGVPEDLRLTYNILRNSHCLPIEMELRKDIYSLRQLLNAAIDPSERRQLRRELNLLILNLNLMRHGSAKLELPQV